jgi:hypothetical protein
MPARSVSADLWPQTRGASLPSAPDRNYTVKSGFCVFLGAAESRPAFRSARARVLYENLKVGCCAGSTRAAVGGSDTAGPGPSLAPPHREAGKRAERAFRADSSQRVRVATNQLERFEPCDSYRIEVRRSRRAGVRVPRRSALSRRAERAPATRYRKRQLLLPLRGDQRPETRDGLR